MEGEVVPSIAREGNRKVGLYEIPERSLNESLNATIARIHATVDFPLQPFVLTSRHGLYSRPSRPLVPPAIRSPPFFTPRRLVLPLMPASRLKRRRALSYGVVTRQFRRLTLRVAGEFSRLTSAQCLCLPRPSHHRDSTRLGLTRLSLILGAARRGATARSRPHGPFLFTCAFFHLGIPPRPLPRRRRTRATFAPVPQAAGTRRASTDARDNTKSLIQLVS